MSKRKKVNNKYKTVEIPHLRFEVHFMDIKWLRGVDIKGAGFTCISGEDEATVFLEDIENTVKNIALMPFLAHEIMHVIQILCDRFSMKIEQEQEHTAYLMHYLMDKLIN